MLAGSCGLVLAASSSAAVFNVCDFDAKGDGKTLDPESGRRRARGRVRRRHRLLSRRHGVEPSFRGYVIESVRKPDSFVPAERNLAFLQALV